MKAVEQRRTTPRSRLSRALRAFRTDVPLTVVMASLPLMLFAAVVVYMLWQQQQHQFELQQKATARAVAVAIEKEIEGTIRQLQYMATSPVLHAGSLEPFMHNARRALAATRHWSNVIVFAEDGRQLLNARFQPPATRSPAGERHVQAVLQSGQPKVSDLFIGPASQRQVVAVTVPAPRDGRAVYAVSAALDFSPIDDLVKQSSGDGAAIVAVWDSQQQFISRSISPQAFRGKKPVPELVAASRAAPEGWKRFITLEGMHVFSAWTPVGSTGWTVGVAVPSGAADVLLRRYLWALVIAEGLILLMTLPLALKLEREARQRAHAEAERDRLFALEREAHAVAETASKAKDEFLAMLGHELRNPLAAVSNAVHLLETGAPERVTFARSLIARQTAHLTRLIDDLLDVGRVITGKISLHREIVDLAAVTHSAVATLRAAGKASAHRLTVNVQPVYVEGDRTRLEQVIVNLLSNALSYSPDGGAVDVSLQRDEAYAVLTVRDTGIGLTHDELERVFELFYQAKGELHRKGGLGIGLTLVRRLVELHGGMVSVESGGKGKGTQFAVRLPAIDSPHIDIKLAATPRRKRTGRSILLIEDNEDARVSLAELLTLDGHEVHQAADGMSGVEAAARLKPEIALVDIGLPKMDGYEVARTLRARNGHRMKLVALTGYGQPADERRAQEAGFDAHLVKPADLDKLREVIETAG